MISGAAYASEPHLVVRRGFSGSIVRESPRSVRVMIDLGYVEGFSSVAISSRRTFTRTSGTHVSACFVTFDDLETYSLA
jgi:hypothetical protein